MLQPLEQVRDHQNPLAHTPALASCQAPQLRRPRFAAKEVYRHCPSPKTWYTRLTALPYLGITGNRYQSSCSASTRNSSGTEWKIPKATDPYPTAPHPKRSRILSTARSAAQRVKPFLLPGRRP